MVRNDDSLGPKTGDQGAGARAPRKRGVFFWIAMVCSPAAGAFAAMDGDLLRVGVFSALWLFLILQQTGLQERSAAWRWGHNACVLVFSALVLLLLLRNLGLV